MTFDRMYYAMIFPICQINGEYLRIKTHVFVKKQSFLWIQSHLNPIFRQNTTFAATLHQIRQRVIFRPSKLAWYLPPRARTMSFARSMPS